MARVETLELNIPVNILILNAETDIQEGSLCTVDIYGCGKDVCIFKSKEEYEKTKSRMDTVSMIPTGTFSAKRGNKDFQESPHIYFTGIVLGTETYTTTGKNEPNYSIHIQTLEFDFNLFLRYDGVIEKDYIVSGIALLIGYMRGDVSANV